MRAESKKAIKLSSAYCPCATSFLITVAPNFTRVRQQTMRRQNLRLLALLAVLALTGCAKSAAIPLSSDTVQITTEGMYACGMDGVQRLAVTRAAVETIKRGFDKFLIVDGAYSKEQTLAGYTPIEARTKSKSEGTIYGDSVSIRTSSTTRVTGGEPLHMITHNQALTVKMFKDDDPLGSNAISARNELGPKWSDIASHPSDNCFE